MKMWSVELSRLNNLTSECVFYGFTFIHSHSHRHPHQPLRYSLQSLTPLITVILEIVVKSNQTIEVFQFI